MGVYESRKTYDHMGSTQGVETFLEEINPGYGERIIRRHVVWVVESIRDSCFCCSCDTDREGSDPFCRNHGFAGMRPCEAHNMPGQPEDMSMLHDGFIGPEPMPESVQVVRRRQAEWDRQLKEKQDSWIRHV